MLKVDLDFPVAGKFDDISSVSIASEVVIDTVKIITVVTSFTPFLQEKFYLPADGDTVSQIKTYYANGRNNGLSEIVVSEGFTVEPPNNWDGFNAYMLTDTDFNTYYGTGLTVAPAVTTSIPTALAQVSTNGVNSFNLTFNGFCNAVNVTATHRNGWADVAESYHLPADFVSVIRGGN